MHRQEQNPDILNERHTNGQYIGKERPSVIVNPCDTPLRYKRNYPQRERDQKKGNLFKQILLRTTPAQQPIVK